MTEFNSALMMLASQPTARLVLDVVAKNKLIQIRDLLEKTKSYANDETTKGIVRELKNLHLVDEKASAVEDFNTIYVTAEGLEANRKVGR